ncbi:hypothetical protein M8C21_003889, partial [Ambrosia artemisiifolia]
MSRFTTSPPSSTTRTMVILILVMFSHMLFVHANVDHSNAVVLHRHTMFLPLFHSMTNSSRVTYGQSRRHLQKSDTNRSNARMGLHDDLLSNGYYTTRLWIGSPPQKFALIVDTGS